MCFDERAATWDDPDKVRQSGEVADAVRRQLDLSGSPRTLELGAGTGLLSRALRDDLGPTTLADSSSGMLEVAREVIEVEGLTGWEAVHVDVDAGSLPEGPYDLVLAQLALHHMQDPRAVVGLVRDVLAPGGQVAIADLELDPHGEFHSHLGDDFTGHHGFDHDDLAGWLTAAGFVDVTTGNATSIMKEVDGVEKPFPVFLVTGRRPA
jgi:ubiquinone/menaquinone biosynthesis C-methylase UbiE